MPAPPGSAGYSDSSTTLLERRVPFEVTHRALPALLPVAPADVLDLGAGPGHDAASLAAMGHCVVAVEPVAALREGGRTLYSDVPIDWRDDCLPRLGGIGGRYDLIMASGVWHHLDPHERTVAMSRVAALLKKDGLFAVSLRHGPVPEGRRGFVVTAAETTAMAKVTELTNVVEVAHDSILAGNRAAGVTWTYLVFRA